MKKTVLALALSLPMLISSNVFANNNDPYDFNDEFKGWFIGGEVNTDAARDNLSLISAINQIKYFYTY